MLAGWIKTEVAKAAAGWQPYGFLPCVASVGDWGCPGCKRPVVVVSYAKFGGSGDLFISECDKVEEAQALADQINKFLDAIWKRHQAAKAAESSKPSILAKLQSAVQMHFAAMAA